MAPRLFTPPLATGPPGPCGCGCALTRATSLGFEAVAFARRIGRPFLPWQRWAVIHALEQVGGRNRFRIILVLVARQNGKTEIPVILSAWWMFRRKIPLILGTSTKLDYARESWAKLIGLAESSTVLRRQLPDRTWYLTNNNEQVAWLGHRIMPDSRYKIAATNSRGGRSLTLHRLIMDELREHDTYDAYAAAVPAGNAVDDFQAWCLSNAGDDTSVVLNDLRDGVVTGDEYVGGGEADFALLEWSAPADADPEDLAALAMANPTLNRRPGIRAATLLSDARRAVRKGGDALTMFRTENMCIRVRVKDPAIDPARYRACRRPGTLAEFRRGVAACLDVSLDLQHATLVAAAKLPDGKVRAEPVQAWTDLQACRRELPAVLTRVRPRVFGWLPSGPAAALAADLADRTARGAPRRGWPPPGVRVEEIRGELTAVCSGLVQMIGAGELEIPPDPLMDDQVGGARKLKRGDSFTFVRDDEGHVDAVYAWAGAVHLARTMPAPPGPPRILTAATPTGII